MSASTYFKNLTINHLMRGEAHTPPAVVYVALFTGDSGLLGDAPTQEVTGASYERKAITLGASTVASTFNTAEIKWDPISEDWGIVTHVAIVTDLVNTNWGSDVHVLAFKPLVSSKNIVSGSIFSFPIGNLDIFY